MHLPTVLSWDFSIHVVMSHAYRARLASLTNMIELIKLRPLFVGLDQYVITYVRLLSFIIQMADRKLMQERRRFGMFILLFYCFEWF